MKNTLQTILDTGIVAIIRSNCSSGLLEAAKALAKGGIKAIEVTLTTPGALDAISSLANQSNGEFVVGAGSVLDAESARMAILAGAEFLVMPNLDLGAIEMAKRYGKVVCAGALTPTEALTAWQGGADIVKIFPASCMGPDYIKALKGPLPQIRLMPVGGVNVDNIEQFIKAGACGVGVGGKLVNTAMIEQKQWDQITEMAKKCIEAIAAGRRGNQ